MGKWQPQHQSVCLTRVVVRVTNRGGYEIAPGKKISHEHTGPPFQRFHPFPLPTRRAPSLPLRCAVCARVSPPARLPLPAAPATCSTNRPFRPFRDAAAPRRRRGAAGRARLPRAAGAARVVPPRASGGGPGRRRAPRPAAAPRALATAPRGGREHAAGVLRAAGAGIQLRWGGRLA